MANLAYAGGVISWSAGDDLGNCATFAQLSALVSDGVLPVHPTNVAVSVWVPADQMSMTVPLEFLNALDDDTLAKLEVGAIAADDNATFSELGDICINEVEGCEEEE